MNNPMFLPGAANDKKFISLIPTKRAPRTYSNTVVRWQLAEAYNAPELIQIHAPEEVYRHYGYLLKDELNEMFYTVCMSSNNRVIALVQTSQGLLNASLTHPREVFRSAIVLNAASVLLMHNHPSGNLEPSREDISITKQLLEAGKIIGINVHDHIIITSHGFTSMLERGLV
jgi:DNA repair protein RadC